MHFPPNGLGLRGKGRLTYVLLMALLLFMGYARPCLAQHIVLENLVVDNQEDRIMIRFGLKLDGAERLAAELERGAVLELIVSADLSQDRSLIWSKGLTDAEHHSTLRFDALTRNYILERPGVDDNLRDKDLEVLLAKAWKHIDLDLGQWSLLAPGESFFIDMSIRLIHQEVPSWMKSVLFFWNWDAVPETTYRMSFQY
ncbi:MAG: DUF4390 domain-containing protein [Desulfovibrio sp.]|uniref:DUF4390 domain-containing protein n=1 Tax=Desulfovibrio sp. 7SRBS1 TaxID=3378064 RepID=UPI003B41487A